MLFGLGGNGWAPVFRAPHPVCGIVVSVPVLALQQLFPGYWAEYGPASTNLRCPGS